MGMATAIADRVRRGAEVIIQEEAGTAIRDQVLLEEAVIIRVVLALETLGADPLDLDRAGILDQVRAGTRAVDHLARGRLGTPGTAQEDLAHLEILGAAQEDLDRMEIPAKTEASVQS